MAHTETAVVNQEADVRVWLEYAEADRYSVRHAMRADDYSDVAFHCQQVAEKLLKAVIVHQTRRRPPHSHNLWRLWRAVSGVKCPSDVREALAALSPHYTLSRYPGMGAKYDRKTAQRMMKRMERVWQWFTQTLNLPIK